MLFICSVPYLKGKIAVSSNDEEDARIKAFEHYILMLIERKYYLVMYADDKSFTRNHNVFLNDLCEFFIKREVEFFDD